MRFRLLGIQLPGTVSLTKTVNIFVLTLGLMAFVFKLATSDLQPCSDTMGDPLLFVLIVVSRTCNKYRNRRIDGQIILSY